MTDSENEKWGCDIFGKLKLTPHAVLSLLAETFGREQISVILCIRVTLAHLAPF